jgi:hypothetical protein
MSKTDLRLDWCSHEAAKYAVEHWHYSRSMPGGKRVHIGVWEGDFIGAVIFAMGANNHIGSPYGLKQIAVCELVRVALRNHVAPVTRIVSIATKMLKRQSPGLRLIVSYADPEQGHIGGIYQAGGWIYVGATEAQREIVGVNGKIIHKRTVNSTRGTVKGLTYSKLLWKHKYLYPLDDAMRAQIAPLAKPYPKRAGSADSGMSDHQSEGGGATPTPALIVERAS